jgi:hypothetical protein
MISPFQISLYCFRIFSERDFLFQNGPYPVLPVTIFLKFGLKKGEEFLLSLIRVNFISGYAFLGK